MIVFDKCMTVQTPYSIQVFISEMSTMTDNLNSNISQLPLTHDRFCHTTWHSINNTDSTRYRCLDIADVAQFPLSYEEDGEHIVNLSMNNLQPKYDEC